MSKAGVEPTCQWCGRKLLPTQATVTDPWGVPYHAKCAEEIEARKPGRILGHGAQAPAERDAGRGAT
jgi:hypothetical protein